MIELDYTSRYFEPPDVDQASDEWNAHCGPISFAAITGKTLAQTRQHFAGIDKRSYVNPTQMKAALDHAGIEYLTTTIGGVFTYARLSLIQIVGPWCAAGVNPKAAYRYTHWIAMRSESETAETWVYDCNVGFWISLDDWTKHTAPELVGLFKRATGWDHRLTLNLNRRHVAAGVVGGTK